MKIAKQLLRLLTLICLVIFIIARTKVSAVVLLVVALVQCVVLVCEHVSKKGK